MGDFKAFMCAHSRLNDEDKERACANFRVDLFMSVCQKKSDTRKFFDSCEIAAKHAWTEAKKA